jgi:hypothetical protein
MFHFQNCAFVFTKLDIRGTDKHLSGKFDFVPYNVNIHLKMTAFWDVAPCSLVDTDRHFRGAIRLMKEAVSSSETLASIYQPTC